MKYFFIILIFTLIIRPSILSSQVKSATLNGIWESINEDSLFYKSDTITFVENINQLVSDTICNTITWEISKRSFIQFSNNKCIEPGRNKALNSKQSIKLKNSNFQELIVIQGRTKESYKILNYKIKKLSKFPHKERILTLLRKDDLNDLKLFNQVSNKIQLYSQELNIAKDILLIINGIPLESINELKKYLLYEIESLNILERQNISEEFPHLQKKLIILIKTHKVK